MKRILLLAFTSVLWLALSMAEPAKPIEATKPAPKPNIPEGAEVITLGAGCFWCTEAVYQQIPGVLSVPSGYMGGAVKNPTYEQVCTGNTGHVEVSQYHYDLKYTTRQQSHMSIRHRRITACPTLQKQTIITLQ